MRRSYNSNNAITKSRIQVLAERADIKNRFFDELADLVEKYEVRDNIFVSDAEGGLHELPGGYYGEVATCESLDEARANFDPATQAIRVRENTFSIGNVYSTISEVKEEVVIDCAHKVIV